MTKTVRCTASSLIIRSLPVGGISTDTGKRAHRAQLMEAYAESFDGKWLYVDAPAGRGWCSKDYLEEAQTVQLVDPPWPKVPHGLAEIKRIFGSPGSAPCRAGRVVLPREIKLGWVDQTITVFACHKLLEDMFEAFFHDLEGHGLLGCIEITRCVQTFDGVYNDRTVTASQKVSTHAWGIALDINAATNRLGARPTLNPKIVQIAKDYQLTWGGVWSRPDGMHFQYATGY